MVQELHWLAVGLAATLKQSKPHFPQLARKRDQQRAGIFLVQPFTGQTRLRLLRGSPGCRQTCCLLLLVRVMSV